MSATQQGVEETIHDKLMATLASSEESAAVEEETTEETEAVEGADVPEDVIELETESEETDSNEAETLEVDAQESEPSVELSHIAEYLGATEDQLTVNDDGDLMVRTKIDGVDGEAKFSELLKSYQLEGHLNKQSTELAETQKALQSKLNEADAQLAQKVQQLEDLSQLAYNDLLTDYNAVNWDDLRADDPAEYAAKKADYQNRQTQISSLYQKALDQRGELAATDTEGLKVKLAEEKQSLLKAIPDWTDPDKYQKGWTEAGTYAQTLGFSSEEFNSTADHRVLVLLDKARQFDELQKGSAKVTKRVRKAPKIAKPGSTAAKIPSKLANEQKLLKQLKRDGGGNALHELLLAKV